MSRESEFVKSYEEYIKIHHVGYEELKTFYLHEIALHLAIIADCLEGKKVRKDVDSDQKHGDADKMQ